MGLYMAEQCQCAHTGQGAAKFAFRRTWTHEEVDTYFKREVFPHALGYATERDKGKSKDRPTYWKLINKEKQRYELAVTRGPPTGEDLYRYGGRPKCPLPDSNVIIGMTTSAL